MMMKQWVVVTGGTGLIGRSVCKRLKKHGYRVRILSRSARVTCEYADEVVQWVPSKGSLDLEALRNTAAVIHLAGAPIAQRWTTKSRQIIMTSRTLSTHTLTQTISLLPETERPPIFVSASAVGIYPNSAEFVDETASLGQGFTSEVTQAWENATRKAENLGCRTIRLRIGLVLASSGGIIGSLKLPFSLGLGSPIGNGQQWQSWIHLEDLSRMLVWSIQERSVEGVYNAVSPNPVTNRVFSKELAHALRRPFFFPPVPAWALKLIFGKMSQVLLASNRINSSKVARSGFKFEYPILAQAMASLFPR